MKITLRKAIALVLALSIYSTLSSQVQGVNYWAKYNSDSLWYDFYIIINNGSAAGNSINAIQFNAQYSIVIATGDSIQLVKSYNPKYDANTPAPWTMSARVNSPQAQPQNDFYSIIPTLGGPNPPMYIDGLFPGDTVKLFSIKRIGQNSLCGKELRIFENGVDPDSSEPGMNYSDFSNGIGIGSTLQLYEGNSEQIAALSPTIQSAISTCNSGIEIDLTANSNGNQGPLSYSWTGPNGYNNTTEDVLISPAVLANNGTYKIIVTDSIGCKDSLEVEGLGKPDAGPDQIVCAGTSHIITGNPLSGTWSSFLGNPAGATRTYISQGVAQVSFSNTASGSYRFRYSIGATGTCNDTVKFTVTPIPNLTLVDNNGCVGDTLLNVLIANGTGSWTSSNPSVASIISVSGQSGSIVCYATGLVTFTFTSASSGCSNETSPFTVNPSPTIVGDYEMCIGSFITLNPNIGGTWSSSSPLIVSVTNSGVATGNSAGIATLVYTDSNGCTDTQQLAVLSNPAVSISDNRICVGSTATLTPVTGGVWTSSNPTVATVEGNVITSHSEGNTTFTFSSGLNCSDDVSLTVDPKPSVSTAQNTICVGELNQLSPTTGGVWINFYPSILSYNSVNKTITGLNAGIGRLLYTETITGCTSDTLSIIVEPRPSLIYDPSGMCIGETKQFSPSTGGTWNSSNNAVATIDNNGLVTAISSGNASFQFTNSSSGCVSDPSDPISVNPKPIISVTGDAILCLGESITLTATGSSGGTWSSSNPSAAAVNSSGIVIALGASTNIRFTYEDPNGCISAPSSPIEVKLKPSVNFIGPNPICINGITNVTSNGAIGIWNSTTPSIAVVNNSGIVTGIADGTCNLIFTQTDGGCISDPLTVTVNPKPIINTAKIKVAVNETTQFNSTNIIINWQSSNNNIVSINSQGLVTGLAKGKAFISGYDINGCESELIEIEVTGYKFILTGFCFTDINQNNIYDDGEDYPLSNCAITKTGSSTIYYTDTDGYFNFEVDSASNEVNYSINFGSWISNSITKTININKPVTYDFVGFKPSANAGTAASVSLSSTAPLCNTFANLNPIAFNESSTLLDGYLVIEYDDRTYFSETLPLPSGGSDNKLIWDFKDLAPGKIFSPFIEYFVPEEITTPDSLHFTAWILDKNSGDTLNIFQFSEEIICNTTPPNVIVESWPDRQGDDNYTLNTETINYSITYRNKGNGTARRVTIETIINEHLDENSLIIKESTFAYEASRNGNLLTIVFDSIELGSSREEEFGNLSYSFSIKNNTPDKTKIFNSIKITMDNGYEYTTDPTLNTVVTILPCDLLNDEINHIDDALSVAETGNLYSWYDCNTNELLQSEPNPFFHPSQNGNYYAIVEGDDCKTITDCYTYLGTNTDDNTTSLIKIYPNPTNSIINIKGLDNNHEVILYNYLGERLIKCKCSTLDISDESNGIYFIEINGEKSKEVSKIVKI